jgi:hypothetical protein
MPETSIVKEEYSSGNHSQVNQQEGPSTDGKMMLGMM